MVVVYAKYSSSVLRNHQRREGTSGIYGRAPRGHRHTLNSSFDCRIPPRRPPSIHAHMDIIPNWKGGFPICLYIVWYITAWRPPGAPQGSKTLIGPFHAFPAPLNNDACMKSIAKRKRRIVLFARMRFSVSSISKVSGVTMVASVENHDLMWRGTPQEG